MSATDSGGDDEPDTKRGIPRNDPTRTTTLRRRYGSQAYRMYRALKGAVRRHVIDENRFGLEYPQANRDVIERHASAEGVETPTPNVNVGRPGMPDPMTLPSIKPPATPNWDFPEDSRKADEFMSWFRSAQDDLLLDPAGATAPGNIWADEYVRYSYYRGLDFAERQMKADGTLGDVDLDTMDTFNMPIHQDALSLIYTRQYNGLKGINDEVAKQVSRVLTEGFAAGQNPRVIARDINDRIDKIGITRARTLARTEIVRTYNESALNRFGQVFGGDASVTIYAEFRTAQDSRVCPICAALDGERFRLKDAHNLIPQHPNCRCVWIPISEKTTAAMSARNAKLAGDIHASFDETEKIPAVDMRTAAFEELAG